MTCAPALCSGTRPAAEPSTHCLRGPYRQCHIFCMCAALLSLSAFLSLTSGTPPHSHNVCMYPLIHAAQCKSSLSIRQRLADMLFVFLCLLTCSFVSVQDMGFSLFD